MIDKRKMMIFFDGGEVSGTEPPSSFTVMKYGKLRYTKGNEPGAIDFTRADADEAVREFCERGKDLVIDYEHKTLSGEEAPAAGWIKALSADDDGLKASVVEWTERAAAMMKAREYRYFSPVIVPSRRRKALHSVALTNHPALHGIPALVADDMEGDEGVQNAVDIAGNNKQTRGLIMKLQKLAALVGAAIPDDMTDEQAVEAIAAGMSRIIDEKRASDAAKAGMVSMTDYEAMKTRVSAMEGEVRKSNARRSVDEGMKARKIAANMEQWAMAFAERDPAGFSDYLKLAPEVVPAAPQGAAPAAVATPAEALALSDTRSKIAERLGFDAAAVYGTSNALKG